MWHYTKGTAADRDRRLGELSEAFERETDCLKYLSEIQSHINSTQTTAVLLQDLEANMLIEMDYVPVNNYVFHVIAIEENGIKNNGLPCQTIEQAVEQFVMQLRAK